MTRFTVLWEQVAEDDLVEIWLKSLNREEVTAATTRVEQELAFDAHLKGRDLHEGLMSLTFPPLRVIFAVYSDDRIVEVLRILES
jgi:hypothetical protein